MKEIEEASEKNRSSRQKEWEKLDTEVNNHFNTKNELRSVQEKLSECKAKFDEQKRKYDREIADLILELDFMKETFNKTESKLKDALNNIEIKEIKITELERERKMAKMQMEEHLRNNNQDRINKIKHKLRLEFSLKLQRIKEEYSRFKVNVVEDVINVKKENGSMIAKIISKIEQHKQIVQEREAKYHEKNSKILQKLQKELESKPERSDEHENSNEVLQRKIRELEQDVVEIQDKLNQALDEKKIIESRYQAWM